MFVLSYVAAVTLTMETTLLSNSLHDNMTTAGIVYPYDLFEEIRRLYLNGPITAR
jgi:hypothetical protein